MRIVFWGTYDIGKPRVRILLKGLKESGIEVLECHSEVWSKVEDKSQITGWKNRTKFILKWLISYPSLIVRYIRFPRHDVAFIGYLGHLDVLIFWPFARLRGVPIVWDAFLSLYDTVVDDRRTLGAKNPMARLLYSWEYLACRAADVVLLDTKAQAEYFINRYRIPPEKTAVIFVGVEPDKFPYLERFVEGKLSRTPTKEITVLFYGQFIPMHGIDTIVKAALLMKDRPVRWILIGKGQEDARIKQMLDTFPMANLEWIDWVDYSELIQWISRADICLGIFGDSDKAKRVIPNKLFQIIAAGRPFITRDSPAIRELLQSDIPGATLIPAADPHALAAAVQDFFENPVFIPKGSVYENLRSRILPSTLGLELLAMIGTRNFAPGAGNRK